MPSAMTSAPQRSARSRSGPDDLEGGLADGAALDERQVDLDDVEPDLAQQAQAGVAGPDVVGRDPHAGGAAGLDGAAQSLEVLDALAFGQFEDHGRRVHAVALEHAQERRHAELVRFERPRREVDRQRAGQPERRERREDRRQAGEVELDGAARLLGGGEQLARVGEARCPAAGGSGPRSRGRPRSSCRRSAGRRPGARRWRRPGRWPPPARPAAGAMRRRAWPGRRSSRTCGRGACPSTARRRPGDTSIRGRTAGPGSALTRRP